jgi:riboflavin kinase/FMN adenylyltransferase
MQVITDLNKIPDISATVVTVGAFDGVHTAHKKLIEFVVAKAKEIGGYSVVVSFDRHPNEITNDDEPLNDFFIITEIEEKIKLIAELGVDFLVLLKFNRSFSHLSYQEFIKDIIIDKLNAKTIVVGYNNSFGKDRDGNVENINAFAKKHNLGVEIFDQLIYEHNNVSSTVIRHSILAGEIELANKLLDYNYFIRGTIKGTVFEPANEDKIIPAYGVYQVAIGDNQYICDVGETIFINNLDTSISDDVTIEFIRRID